MIKDGAQICCPHPGITLSIALCGNTIPDGYRYQSRTFPANHNVAHPGKGGFRSCHFQTLSAWMCRAVGAVRELP
jgi:hypothetical protein